MPNEEYPFTSFNFIIQLTVPDAERLGMSKQLCNMEFSDLDGLEMSMEPKTVREGGNNTAVTNLVGRVSFSNLTLKRGMTSNLDLWKWFAAATGNTNRSLRANGIIQVKDSFGTTRARYWLYGCLPIKIKAPTLNAKDGGIAIEEMEIAVNSFKMEGVE